MVFSEADPGYPIGHGSGVVVSPDTILTNTHVVDEDAFETRITHHHRPRQGGKTYDAEVIDRSPGNDLALIACARGRA